MTDREAYLLRENTGTTGLELTARAAAEALAHFDIPHLIVGGLAEGVYEISKDFRNEGMDKNHSPEFTMAEIYIAYKDYEWMMAFTEEMFAEVAREVMGGMKFGDVDFTPPFRRLSMFDSIKEYTQIDVSQMKGLVFAPRDPTQQCVLVLSWRPQSARH